MGDYEHVEILNALGLTLNEARIFVALSKLGVATAKAVSKTSGISREIVYQTMARLEEKRLVGEKLASPKTFQALPIGEVYEILLEHKKEEDKELRGKIKKALKTHRGAENLQVNDPQTIIVTPRGKNKGFIVNEYRNALVTVDMIIPLNKFIQWAQTVAEECIDGAMKKNAKIRLITEKPVSELLQKASKSLGENVVSKLRQIEYRFVAEAPPIEMALFDKKTVFIATCQEKLIKNMVWLRSNNSPIIELANKYFETSWNEKKAETETLTIAL
jgi:sugar-specific transcriptional regulator TrmB